MSNPSNYGHTDSRIDAAQSSYNRAAAVNVLFTPAKVSRADALRLPDGFCPFLSSMPIDVSSDVLEIVQRVCDKALNVAKARAASSALGPKAGMRALFGKTVKHLPRGEGVVKDRVLKLAERKKRRSGRSGASNWPRGTKETRERFKAECARRAAERAAAAALREAMSELDDGSGPYMVRSPDEWLAITQVRRALASEMGLSPNQLRPSAAVAATLVPGSIDAYTNGYLVAISEGTISGVRAGDSLRVREGGLMCEFATPGVERAIVFHAN